MAYLLIAAVAIAAIVSFTLWSRSRRRHPAFEIPAGLDRDTLIRNLAAFTWGRVLHGNAVRIVQDAGFFDAVTDDIARATHHVHLETFLWMDGEVSDRIVTSIGPSSPPDMTLARIQGDAHRRHGTDEAETPMRTGG